MCRDWHRQQTSIFFISCPSHIIAQLFVASVFNVDLASPIPLNRFRLIKDLDLFKSPLFWLLVPTEERAATSKTSLTLLSEVLAEVSE